MARTQIRPTMTSYEVPSELPTRFYSLIGQITFQWSRVENALTIAAKRMLDINLKEARIAMRSRRPNEVLAMIEQLAFLYDEDVGDWGELSSKLDVGERYRNKLLHAVWLKRNDKLYLQETKGLKNLPNNRQVDRTLYPDKLEITEQWLENRLAEAKETLKQVSKLQDRTAELAASRSPRTQGAPAGRRLPAESEEESSHLPKQRG